MVNGTVTRGLEEDRIDTTLSPQVVQQLEKVVGQAERGHQREESPTPFWHYSIPCAGVRYYRY